MLGDPSQQWQHPGLDVLEHEGRLLGSHVLCDSSEFFREVHVWIETGIYADGVVLLVFIHSLDECQVVGVELNVQSVTAGMYMVFGVVIA